MLARVEIIAKLDGHEPLLLGYAIGTLLADEPADVDKLTLGKTLDALHDEAHADARKRLRALAFYEIAKQVAQTTAETETSASAGPASG